jgi:signal transduction histidine kinase
MADRNEAVMATAVNNQGVWAQDRGDHHTALRLFSQAQALYIKLGDSIGVSYTMDYSAVSYAAQKSYALATQLQTESYYIRLRQKDTNAASLSVFSLAEIALEEGKQLQAKNYLLQCLAISERIKYKELSLQCYKKLAEICSNAGDAESAYRYHVRYAALNEEIFNEKRSKQISELQTKYETDKRLQQITILTKDMELKDKQHRIQRNLLISALLLILIAVIALYFYYRGKRQREKDQAIILEKEQRSKAIIETEEKERMRIARDLHDGIAQTMTAAKMQLEHFMEETEKTLQIPDSLKYAYDLVVDSAKEVRTISHSMIPNALIKSGLVAAVRDFVNRMGNEKLKINLVVLGLDERLNSNAETVIFRVLQELISNIIKHAQANEITIQLIREKNEFTLMVEDNGKGFDLEKAGSQDGIGLKNIRSRVEYLNGSVSFDSAPGKGTTIVVEIPV